MSSDLPQILVRLPSNVYDAVKRAAEADSRSMSNYVAGLLARAHPEAGGEVSRSRRRQRKTPPRRT